MATNVSIYSNANSASKSVTFDFVGDVLASHNGFNTNNAAAYTFYFKVTTSAKFVNGTTTGGSYPIVKTMPTLSELALNGIRQSNSGSSSAYVDIKSMIVDYTDDYVYGHTANEAGSGVTYQGPMKFK